MRPPPLFEQPEHRPFLWEDGLPGALLVHGFPGTPVEVRSLAPQAFVPTLVVQGIHDEVAHPGYTRGLLQRLPGPVRYYEVAAGHDLLNPERSAWPQVDGLCWTSRMSFRPR